MSVRTRIAKGHVHCTYQREDNGCCCSAVVESVPRSSTLFFSFLLLSFLLLFHLVATWLARKRYSTCLALSCLAALNPLLVKRRRNLSPFVWRSGGASAERLRLGPLVGTWSAFGRLDHITTTTAGKDCLARTGSS